jgi:hypothetical protein
LKPFLCEGLYGLRLTLIDTISNAIGLFYFIFAQKEWARKGGLEKQIVIFLLQFVIKK